MLYILLELVTCFYCSLRNYDYRGFCKFGSECINHHFQEICHDKQCRNHLCPKRHPRMCYFFVNFGNCKFSKECRYLHEISNPVTPVIVEVKDNLEEVKELQIKIESLQNEIIERKEIKYKKEIDMPKKVHI